MITNYGENQEICESLFLPQNQRYWALRAYFHILSSSISIEPILIIFLIFCSFSVTFPLYPKDTMLIVNWILIEYKFETTAYGDWIMGTANVKKCN